MSSEELLRTSRRHPKMDDRGMMDVPFLVLVLLLVAIGLLMMFSASYVRANYETGNSLHYFIRQASFAAVGLAAMFGASRFSCHIWQKLAAGGGALCGRLRRWRQAVDQSGRSAVSAL